MSCELVFGFTVSLAAFQNSFLTGMEPDRKVHLARSPSPNSRLAILATCHLSIRLAIAMQTMNWLRNVVWSCSVMHTVQWGGTVEEYAILSNRHGFFGTPSGQPGRHRGAGCGGG